MVCPITYRATIKNIRLSIQTGVTAVGPLLVLVKVRVAGDGAASAVREERVCQRASSAVERIAVSVRPRRKHDLDVGNPVGLGERQRRHFAPHLQVGGKKNDPSATISQKVTKRFVKRKRKERRVFI